MKISIITPSFNQGEYIEECIQSALNQNYPFIEHIIVDGGSTDNTIDILKKYNHLIWVSEKDEGQADALNKGLKMAKGEIIGWINSDDYYLPGVFKSIANAFINHQAKWIVSDQYYLRDGELKESIINEINHKTLLHNPDQVKQQGAFYLKSFLEQAGGFNKDFYMVMDLDLWLRLAKIEAPHKLQQFTSCFRLHDDQKTSSKNILRQLKEIKTLMRREKAPKLWVYRIIYKKRKSYFKKIIKRILCSMGLLNKKYLTRPVRS